MQIQQIENKNSLEACNKNSIEAWNKNSIEVFEKSSGFISNYLYLQDYSIIVL